MKIKRKQEEFEKKQNAVYIKMVIDQDERDRLNQKNAEAKHKQKRLAVQKFQLMQIGKLPAEEPDIISHHNSPTNDTQSLGTLTNTAKKNPGHREGMSVEEIRLNKQLLAKISKFKKETGQSNVARDQRCLSQESNPQFN